MPEAPKTSSQYFCNTKITQKNVKDEVGFLPADKRQMFPQIYIIILVVCEQGCPNY